MRHFEIKTIENVKTFIAWCINDKNLIYHPDNKFEDYIAVLAKDENEMIFSIDEAKYLNTCQELAFEVCEKTLPQDEDIYSLAMEIEQRRQYNDNPHIKEALINGLEQCTEDMQVAQVAGPVGYFSASAFMVPSGELEITVHYGSLEDSNIFDSPIIDQFIII